MEYDSTSGVRSRNTQASQTDKSISASTNTEGMVEVTVDEDIKTESMSMHQIGGLVDLVLSDGNPGTSQKKVTMLDVLHEAEKEKRLENIIGEYDEKAEKIKNQERRNWPKTVMTHFVAPVLIIYGTLSVGRDIYSVAQARSDSRSGMSMSKATSQDAEHQLFDGHVAISKARTGVSYRVKAYLNPAATEEVTMDGVMANIADVASPVDAEKEVPFFWIVENMAQHIVTQFMMCMSMNMALPLDEVGKGPSFDMMPGALDEYYGSNINVNMGNLESIQYAQDNKMMKNTDVGFVASPHLVETASLFNSKRKGRIFGLFPNIIGKVQGNFYDLQKNGYYNGTLLDFVRSDHVLANNYITRILSARWRDDEPVTEEDFQKAIVLLKTKFVLVTNASQRLLIEKLVDIYGWNKLSVACIYPPPLLRDANKPKKRHAPRDPPDEEQLEIERIIAERNYYDVQLFEIAKQSGSYLTNPNTPVVDHTVKGGNGVLNGLGVLLKFIP